MIGEIPFSAVCHVGSDTTPNHYAAFKGLPKTKETIEEYIWAFCGLENSSLGYIIREDIFLPAAIINPVWGTVRSRYD